MDGRGVIYMTNGEKLVANFADGKAQGWAEIFDKDGRGERAEYQDDIRV